MATWGAFAAAEPYMAAGMRELFYQYGPGLGLLATTRADGGPRLHPVCPVITDDGLYCFVVDSPKRRDLERDGRYALHANPPEDVDDEALLMGRAERSDDPQRGHRGVPPPGRARRGVALQLHRGARPAGEEA